MNESLQKSATDVLDMSVKTASGTTIGTGLLTAFNVLPQLLGGVASLVGIYVTIMLYRKKSRIYKLQEEELRRRGND